MCDSLQTGTQTDTTHPHMTKHMIHGCTLVKPNLFLWHIKKTIILKKMLNKTSAKENQINRADTNWICEGRTWPISYYTTFRTEFRWGKICTHNKNSTGKKNSFRFMHCHLTKASFCQARESSSRLTRRKDSKTVRLRPSLNVLIGWMET